MDIDFDESLSYTDAKGNPLTAKVSNVFKKCANVYLHIRVVFCLNGMNGSLRLLVYKKIIQTTHSTIFILFAT